jgi:rubrerythrin
MKEKTTINTKLAFQGEAEASFRTRAFANVAEKEGYEQIARLFRAMSEASAVQCLNMLKLRGIVKDTENNLEQAFSTETYALEEAYPKLIQDAEDEGEKRAAVVFSQARDVEEMLAALYKKAMADMMADRTSEYHVCTICGYISDFGAPDSCPICGAKAAMFKLVD